MGRIIFQGLVFLVTLLWVSVSLGQTLSLEWDPNNDPNVAGYLVYYQDGSPQPPFVGEGALQGGSPIDTGPDNFLDLDLPDDGRVYYFAVTAYDDAGQESAYSNIVASRPRPVLLTPVRASQLADPTVTFSWFHEVTDPQTTYTLIIGPEAEVGEAGFFGYSGKPGSAWWLVALGMAGGWFLVFRLRRGTLCQMLLVSILGASLVTACGGGGEFDDLINNGNVPVGEVGSGPVGADSGDSTVPSEEIDPPLEEGSSTPEDPVDPSDESTIPTDTGSLPDVEMPVVETFFISGISDQFIDVVGLEPGQTYYWKIVAVDGQGQEIESEVFHFTTAN